MPNTNKSVTPSYLLTTIMLFPAALAFTSVVAIRHRKLDYLKQRLGMFPTNKAEQKPVWIHCASVGEANTALPLIRALLDKNHHLLISTSTITGQDTLKKAKLIKTTLVFLPLDYAWFARQLIKKYQPSVMLIFETELWPSIILTAQRHIIPNAIINARLSEKTLNAPGFIKKNYARLLVNVEKIYASSSNNVERFISIGANKDQIVMQDNLKFSTTVSNNKNLKNPLPFPFMLCASTRNGEEEKIISQWNKLNQSKCALVIAPRHPTRIKDVCKLLEKNQLQYNLHSHRNNNYSIDSIYLIDTLGELAPFMQYAQLVFVGGSLTPHGGHNVLEPASLGKCVMVGPHTQNISEVVNELEKHHALTKVQDETELGDTIKQLLANRIQRELMEENARKFVASKKHVLKNYIKEISNFIQHHAS